MDKSSTEQDLIFIKLNMPEQYDLIKEIIQLRKKKRKERAIS
ncbi:hypothetical protein [Clostridium perfringens]